MLRADPGGMNGYRGSIATTAANYARSYGDEAAEQIPEHGKWIYLREDKLLPLVERFFAERIFGPMRVEKLERQLRAHGRKTKRKSKDTHKRLREEIADLDRRIGLQIDALEQGIEPELVGERIAQLRLEKEQAEAALRDVAPDTAEPDADELIAALSRVPDLSQAVRDAPMEVERRIEISATVAEAVAKAFENAKDLPEEVSAVAQRDIAGAGFEPATFGL